MGIKDNQVQNPILEVRASNYKDETRVSSFLGNGYIELTPLKGLSFKSSLSASVYNSRQGIFQGADSKGQAPQVAGGKEFVQLLTAPIPGTMY